MHDDLDLMMVKRALTERSGFDNCGCFDSHSGLEPVPNNSLQSLHTFSLWPAMPRLIIVPKLWNSTIGLNQD